MNARVFSLMLTQVVALVTCLSGASQLAKAQAPLRLEAEESLDRSYSCTSFGSGISVQTTNPKDYDAWFKYHPVHLNEGYTSLTVRYAHHVTAYEMKLEMWTFDNGAWNYVAQVNLPSTGGWANYQTATMNLPSPLAGRKRDVRFFVRTPGTQPQYISFDYFEFGAPQPSVGNTNWITNWNLFANGKPNLNTFASSANISVNGNGTSTLIIENKKFYPGKDQYAISISNRQQGPVIIRNCYFGGNNGSAPDGLDPGNGMGIKIFNCSNVRVENCYFDFIQRNGIWAEGTGTAQNPAPNNNIVLYNNKFYCMQGQPYPGTNWYWDCKFIQFHNIKGTGNKIWYNRMFNYPGISYALDWINIYISSGTATEPIMVFHNELLGGGGLGLYSIIGAGIQIGDHSSNNDGGEYVYAKYNRLVYPGMVGMNINGGYKHQMSHNLLFSDYRQGTSQRIRYINGNSVISLGYTWTGMTLFNYSGGISRDSHHSVIGNRVGFQYQSGFVNQTNPPNTTISGNQFPAVLYPLEILPYDFMSN